MSTELNINDAIKALNSYHTLRSKVSSNVDDILSKFKGKHVIITGNPRIGDLHFKNSFPQGIFGIVIGYHLSKGFLLRTYWRKRKGEKKHSHTYAHPKYIKIL